MRAERELCDGGLEEGVAADPGLLPYPSARLFAQLGPGLAGEMKRARAWVSRAFILAHSRLSQHFLSLKYEII